MEYSAKARLPLQICWYHLSFALLINIQLAYTFTHIFLPKGENHRALKILRFWRLMPKGEKLISLKQKDRTTISTISQKGIHYFNWYLFHKRKKPFQLQKPSWQLRGELLEESFLFSQRKAFETRGEFSKSWKWILKIIFLYLWIFAKEFKKTFPKDLQKQVKWCKCGPKC
jgi:hypothetical protein